MGDTSDIRPDHTHRYEIAADFSLKGAQVVAVLERLKGTIGLPQRIAVDNGPEFISKVLDA